MKLFYYQFSERYQGGRNFGDDLNPYLWDRLLPGVLDDDESVLFIGIGTLLNTKIPRARHTVVFGSGAGYGDLPPVDDSWHFYGVRGPLTAQKLGLDASQAITDSALLIRNVVAPKAPQTTKPRHAVAYMPHVVQVYRRPNYWQKVCERAGISFLDPRGTVEEVLDFLGHTGLLLTEAMHGAIVADALRVPWAAVRTDEAILEWKWDDWCQSLGLSYKPSLVVAPPTPGGRGIKARLLRRHSFRHSTCELQRIARAASPQLSATEVQDRALAGLNVQLERFKRDVLAGRFA